MVSSQISSTAPVKLSVQIFNELIFNHRNFLIDIQYGFLIMD